jgi:hypothetical protein
MTSTSRPTLAFVAALTATAVALPKSAEAQPFPLLPTPNFHFFQPRGGSGADNGPLTAAHPIINFAVQSLLAKASPECHKMIYSEYARYQATPTGQANVRSVVTACGDEIGGSVVLEQLLVGGLSASFSMASSTCQAAGAKAGNDYQNTGVIEIKSVITACKTDAVKGLFALGAITVIIKAIENGRNDQPYYVPRGYGRCYGPGFMCN